MSKVGLDDTTRTYKDKDKERKKETVKGEEGRDGQPVYD